MHTRPEPQAFSHQLITYETSDRQLLANMMAGMARYYWVVANSWLQDSQLTVLWEYAPDRFDLDMAEWRGGTYRH